MFSPLITRDVHWQTTKAIWRCLYSTIHFHSLSHRFTNSPSHNSFFFFFFWKRPCYSSVTICLERGHYFSILPHWFSDCELWDSGAVPWWVQGLGFVWGHVCVLPVVEEWPPGVVLLRLTTVSSQLQSSSPDTRPPLQRLSEALKLKCTTKNQLGNNGNILNLI